MTATQTPTGETGTPKKSLLQLLEDKGVFAKMMKRERDNTFVSESYGSCGVDLGHTSYDERQIKTLLVSVPEIFSDYWAWNEYTELSGEQLRVLAEINKGVHLAKQMNLFHIHKIISKARIYAGI